MDELLSDNTEDDGFSDTRVYVNTVDDYPFDLDFEVPFNCLVYNSYITGAKQQQYYFIDGPSGTCRNNNYLTNSYGANYTPTRETLCNSLLVQRNVWKKCQCFLDSLPNNETSYFTTDLCKLNNTYSECAGNVVDAMQDSTTKECLPFCTKTDYEITYKSKPFFTSDFSEQMDDLLDSVAVCADTNDCQSYTNCIVKKLFENTTSIVCSNFSPISSITSTSSTADCYKISLGLELRPKMQILKESLVVEFNTLLSQTGGMCAFVTGLTITFIAEVLEVFIFWINDKVESRKLQN